MLAIGPLKSDVQHLVEAITIGGKPPANPDQWEQVQRHLVKLESWALLRELWSSEQLEALDLPPLQSVQVSMLDSVVHSNHTIPLSLSHRARHSTHSQELSQQ